MTMQNPLQETVQKYGNQQAWNVLVESKITPWNLGQPSGALVDFLPRIPTSGLFLVPGCGQGYDCHLLASTSADRKVYGWDLVQKQVDETTQIWKNKQLPNLIFECQDFYKDGSIQPGTVDFVFDYTFLCAMDVDWRPKWAKRMAELITSGGYLLTQMFPLDEMTEGWEKRGPPFCLSVPIYHELLDADFECLGVEDCRSTSSARVGREKIALWKRR